MVSRLILHISREIHAGVVYGHTSRHRMDERVRQTETWQMDVQALMTFLTSHVNELSARPCAAPARASWQHVWLVTLFDALCHRYDLIHDL